MTLFYRRVGYAYTPKLGERPVYRAEVEIDGRPQQFEMRANDVFEACQIICRRLGLPFSMHNLA